MIREIYNRYYEEEILTNLFLKETTNMDTIENKIGTTAVTDNPEFEATYTYDPLKKFFEGVLTGGVIIGVITLAKNAIPKHKARKEQKDINKSIALLQKNGYEISTPVVDECDEDVEVDVVEE